MKLFNANKLTNRRYGAHSVFENTYHLVFSTKKRAKYLNVFTKIKIRNFLREYRN
jgi:REP element-mobilizing transposase RayT